MFGYVRPEKGDLLVRDFTDYKAVYCGLCKALGKRCGQVMRSAVSYDMTFLALLLIALAPEDPLLNEEGCFLNPVKKKGIVKDHPALDFSADMTSLLAYYSAKDDAADEKPVKGRLMAAVFSPSARKAARRHPDLDREIRSHLTRLQDSEKGQDPLLAARPFGLLLQALFREGYRFLGLDDEVSLHLLEEAGRALGTWVYLMDAIDDLEEDRRTGSPNPFLPRPLEEAQKLAEELLIEAEEEVDRYLALVTYERLGQLVYNIVVLGLPASRRCILAGESLPAL